MRRQVNDYRDHHHGGNRQSHSHHHHHHGSAGRSSSSSRIPLPPPPLAPNSMPHHHHHHSNHHHSNHHNLGPSRIPTNSHFHNHPSSNANNPNSQQQQQQNGSSSSSSASQLQDPPSSQRPLSGHRIISSQLPNSIYNKAGPGQKSSTLPSYTQILYKSEMIDIGSQLVNSDVTDPRLNNSRVGLNNNNNNTNTIPINNNSSATTTTSTNAATSLPQSNEDSLIFTKIHSSSEDLLNLDSIKVTSSELMTKRMNKIKKPIANVADSTTHRIDDQSSSEVSSSSDADLTKVLTTTSTTTTSKLITSVSRKPVMNLPLPKFACVLQTNHHHINHHHNNTHPPHHHHNHHHNNHHHHPPHPHNHHLSHSHNENITKKPSPDRDLTTVSSSNKLLLNKTPLLSLSTRHHISPSSLASFSSTQPTATVTPMVDYSKFNIRKKTPPSSMGLNRDHSTSVATSISAPSAASTSSDEDKASEDNVSVASSVVAASQSSDKEHHEQPLSIKIEQNSMSSSIMDTSPIAAPSPPIEKPATPKPPTPKPPTPKATTTSKPPTPKPQTPQRLASPQLASPQPRPPPSRSAIEVAGKTIAVQIPDKNTVIRKEKSEDSAKNSNENIPTNDSAKKKFDVKKNRKKFEQKLKERLQAKSKDKFRVKKRRAGGEKPSATKLKSVTPKRGLKNRVKTKSGLKGSRDKSKQRKSNLFDFDEEPIYLSMYDKVKARSSANQSHTTTTTSATPTVNITTSSSPTNKKTSSNLNTKRSKKTTQSNRKEKIETDSDSEQSGDDDRDDENSNKDEDDDSASETRVASPPKSPIKRERMQSPKVEPTVAIKKPKTESKRIALKDFELPPQTATLAKSSSSISTSSSLSTTSSSSSSSSSASSSSSSSSEDEEEDEDAELSAIVAEAAGKIGNEISVIEAASSPQLSPPPSPVSMNVGFLMSANDSKSNIEESIPPSPDTWTKQLVSNPLHISLPHINQMSTPATPSPHKSVNSDLVLSSPGICSKVTVTPECSPSAKISSLATEAPMDSRCETEEAISTLLMEMDTDAAKSICPEDNEDDNQSVASSVIGGSQVSDKEPHDQQLLIQIQQPITSGSPRLETSPIAVVLSPPIEKSLKPPTPKSTTPIPPTPQQPSPTLSSPQQEVPAVTVDQKSSPKDIDIPESVTELLKIQTPRREPTPPPLQPQQSGLLLQVHQPNSQSMRVSEPLRPVVEPNQIGKHPASDDQSTSDADAKAEHKRLRRSTRKKSLHIQLNAPTSSESSPHPRQNMGPQPSKMSPYDIFEFRDSDDDEAKPKGSVDSGSAPKVDESAVSVSQVEKPKPELGQKVDEESMRVEEVKEDLIIQNKLELQTQPEPIAIIHDQPPEVQRGPAPEPIQQHVIDDKSDGITPMIVDSEPSIKTDTLDLTQQPTPTDREYITELNQDGKLSLTIRKAFNQRAPTPPPNITSAPASTPGPALASTPAPTPASTPANMKPTRRSARLMQSATKVQPNSGVAGATERKSRRNARVMNKVSGTNEEPEEKVQNSDLMVGTEQISNVEAQCPIEVPKVLQQQPNVDQKSVVEQQLPHQPTQPPVQHVQPQQAPMQVIEHIKPTPMVVEPTPVVKETTPSPMTEPNKQATQFFIPSYLPPRKRLGWFWSQKQLLEQRYLVVWTSRFTLKDAFAAVQMHFISGNNKMPSWSYRAMLDETGMPLPIQINQRMRLDPDQLEGVQRKMSNEEDHCVLLALPVGRDQSEYLKQSQSLKIGFIDYLISKEAAGIVYVCQPGESQPSYIIHIFPSCTFVNDHILRCEPDLLSVTQNIDNLIVVITTA